MIKKARGWRRAWVPWVDVRQAAKQLVLLNPGELPDLPAGKEIDPPQSRHARHMLNLAHPTRFERVTYA